MDIKILQHVFISSNNLVNIADSIILIIVLDIAIGLKLLTSPGSFAFLFKQNNLLVIISSGITPGIKYLFNIFFIIS